MHDHTKIDSFGKERAESYDESISHLIPINENLLYLMKLILDDCPPNANLLCIGAGTGNEIIQLAQAFPQFNFTAVEPSASMLEVCTRKLEKLNLLNRCIDSWIH